MARGALRQSSVTRRGAGVAELRLCHRIQGPTKRARPGKLTGLHSAGIYQELPTLRQASSVICPGVEAGSHSPRWA